MSEVRALIRIHRIATCEESGRARLLYLSHKEQSTIDPMNIRHKEAMQSAPPCVRASAWEEKYL